VGVVEVHFMFPLRPHLTALQTETDENFGVTSGFLTNIYYESCPLQEQYICEHFHRIFGQNRRIWTWLE